MMVINEGVVINCRYVVDLSSENPEKSHYKERKIAININKHLCLLHTGSLTQQSGLVEM